MNWDDLRIIAAVRDEGTYAGASARLRIDETTVGRRLARIERALGLRLFEAVDGVRKPTRQCDMVLAHIEAMAAHAEEIGRIGESLPGPVGRLRIASTSAIAEEVLAPRASEFLRAHPGLTLQFLTSSDNVKFSRWEADLAIRLRKPDKGDFAISKLAEVRSYFFEPAATTAGEAMLCAYPDELGGIPEMQFLRAKRLRARCVTDNVRIIQTLIQSHHAVGVLPEHSCADLLTDRRLRATLLPKRRDVWLLVQNHLKRDAATRVTIDWLRACFQDAAQRG
ncbi:LysR family transcriptional regulator [Bradyrhizobium elkanii]|uniref:DNA-binding transcriptional LysR family regulator n=1 Tax=Bradyrhizobium elkanii TaxID=29448 RepID=A0A7Y8QY27_BRAEL|nr:LysR family transcriptional regulator [Bradyrhizobium elkanii]MBP1296129.1 DNA-binding transcriptional LysR family regulator [Bradyrhizobium elkanii]MCP1749864.1 DNA-binding transcriptional LysR family regulator [Bradyrhizobium elkanii]MCP1984438.1 DNA-binding transcriptional LysR family regulator [Bradyrhizobium elkanii]MCS3692839.1 DNA-binding transcriptional LysR family regulator [Bradyrhizobium elkanii]MCS3889843.1 DNA-binding transcriptional LysR family regulator [Bradyrhizobium elkani